MPKERPNLENSSFLVLIRSYGANTLFFSTLMNDCLSIRPSPPLFVGLPTRYRPRPFLLYLETYNKSISVGVARVRHCAIRNSTATERVLQIGIENHRRSTICALETRSFICILLLMRCAPLVKRTIKFPVDAKSLVVVRYHHK